MLIDFITKLTCMLEFVYLRFVLIQFVLRVKRFITASTVYWFQIISLFYRIMARAILSSLDWTAAYLTVIASIFITVRLTHVCVQGMFFRNSYRAGRAGQFVGTRVLV